MKATGELSTRGVWEADVQPAAICIFRSLLHVQGATATPPTRSAVLTATPKNILAHDFHIQRDGEPVAFLDRALLRRKGVIEIEDARLSVQTDGFLHPEYTLLLDEKPVARAHKPSVVRDVIQLQLGDVTCEIRRKAWFSTRFYVWNGDQRIGEIARQHWYSWKARVELPDDWPLGLQIFVFWIVLLFWKRDAAAANGS